MPERAFRAAAFSSRESPSRRARLAASLAGIYPPREMPVGLATVGGRGCCVESGCDAQAPMAHRTAAILFMHRAHLFTSRGIWLLLDQRDASSSFRRVVPSALQANEAILPSASTAKPAFTSLFRPFLQGTIATFTFDPAPTPLGWYSTWLGAIYADDSIRLGKNLKLTVGFRDEFSGGWNEAHGRASNYGYRERRNFRDADYRRSSDLTTNNAKFLPQPRLGLAWSPFGSSEDGRARGLRNVQRSARRAGLSHGPECSVQPDL